MTDLYQIEENPRLTVFDSLEDHAVDLVIDWKANGQWDSVRKHVPLWKLVDHDSRYREICEVEDECRAKIRRLQEEMELNLTP